MTDKFTASELTVENFKDFLLEIENNNLKNIDREDKKSMVAKIIRSYEEAKRMVINSIKITNFRCYYGTNTLSFNSNGKITLIYGDSGYGKSSLLQFFRWMVSMGNVILVKIMISHYSIWRPIMTVRWVIR